MQAWNKEAQPWNEQIPAVLIKYTLELNKYSRKFYIYRRENEKYGRL